MKHLKKILAVLIVLSTLASFFAVTASAAGTIAYGAATVKASTLNIRSGPSTGDSVVGSVSSGKIVVILEKTSSSWYKINYEGKVGYVSADYLTNVLTAENFNATGKLNSTGVRVRSKPDTSSSIVGTYSNGTTFNVIGINNGWYKVSFNGTYGYVRSDLMDIVSGSASGTASSSSSTSMNKTGTIKESGVRVRSKPDTSSSILGTYSTGKTFTVVGTEGDWYKISINGGYGYVRSDLMTLSDGSTSTSTSMNKTGTIKSSGVRVRSQPNTTSSILGTYSTGKTFTVVGMEGDWYKVSINGGYGYVRSDLMTLSDGSTSSSSSMNATGTIKGSGVRVRSQPNTTSSILGTYSTGKTFPVVGIDNDWYKVSINSGYGYVRSDLMTISNGSSSGTSSSSSLGSQIANLALKYVGYSYVYGAESPSEGFDCSGLVYYVCGQLGYSVSRTATQQYKNNGTSVSKSDLQPGDLVFFSSDGVGVTHVGIYIGDGSFVHASTSKTGVIISDLNSSYYTRVWWGAKRIG